VTQLRIPLRALLRKKTDIKAGEKDLPQHIAIVMDGNGRWAKKRGLPRTAGHHAGMEALKRIVGAAGEIGIKVLTVYAFSTENWRRPQPEVEFLMRLPNEYLKTELAELNKNNIKLRFMGEMEGLPVHTRQAVTQALAETAGNTGMILNFALNYGSRAELVSAVRQIARQASDGLLRAEEIDDAAIEKYLYTAGLPDPDLFIRPSGESRLSNFLLWQVAYTELWFSDVYWPDFDKTHLLEAIDAYQNRDRRYGGIKL
jgi:undecaprenyl diphosphate synthase